MRRTAAIVVAVTALLATPRASAQVTIGALSGPAAPTFPGLEVTLQGQWPVLDGPLSRPLDPAGAAIPVRTPTREALSRQADPPGPGS